MPKITVLIFLLSSSLFCQMNLDDVLNRSQQFHDPNSDYKQISFKLEIQEPRISNPSRSSRIKLNNLNGTFELIRSRGENFSTHQVLEDGSLNVLFNNSNKFSDKEKKENRLGLDRVKNYHNYYIMFYGALVHQLADKSFAESTSLSELKFEGEDAYKIKFALKAKVFSDKWAVYFSKKDFRILALDFLAEEKETGGERLIFKDHFEIQGLILPRFRHWYEIKTKKYLGSDIVVTAK